MPRMELKQSIEPPVAPFNPVRPMRKEKRKMKALNITLTVLAWVAVGFVLWAIFPILLKIFALGSKLHNSWL